MDACIFEVWCLPRPTVETGRKGVTKEGRRSVDSLPLPVDIFLAGEFAGRCVCACRNNKVIRATSLSCCFMLIFGCPYPKPQCWTGRLKKSRTRLGRHGCAQLEVQSLPGFLAPFFPGTRWKHCIRSGKRASLGRGCPGHFDVQEVGGREAGGLVGLRWKVQRRCSPAPLFGTESSRRVPTTDRAAEFR